MAENNSLLALGQGEGFALNPTFADDGTFTVERWPAVIELDLDSLPREYSKVDGNGIITIRASNGTAWYKIDDYDRGRPNRVVARRVPMPASYYFERR